jgi:hypothetical protein
MLNNELMYHRKVLYQNVEQHPREMDLSSFFYRSIILPELQQVSKQNWVNFECEEQQVRVRQMEME